MNTLHKGVTMLLCSAVTGEKLELPEDFRLEEADELIRSQSLAPMVYLGAYHCGISPDSEIMQRYKRLYLGALMRHEQQMRAVDGICRAFEENGIDYALLKGCVMKPLYPNPEMRVMGDADILIRKEQYGKIRTVMEGLEFEEKGESACNYTWKSKNLLTELHFRLYKPDVEDLCRYFDDTLWDRVENVAGNHYALTAEDSYLHIFSHMAKHFRTWGIGSRQLIDVYVYRKAFPDMDEKRIAAGLRTMGLLEFHDHILQLLSVWFGEETPTPVEEAMTSYFFSCGNWGNEENNLQTEALACAKSGNGGRGASFVRMIFPDLAYLQNQYSTLLRHPWLQPVFWVIRWFDILLNRRKNIGRRLGILKDMSEDKISRRKAFLDAVGLDFYEK